MNLFEEIEEVKKDFPKMNTVKQHMGGYHLNGYQIFAIATYVICFCLGIILGNLFPACGSSSSMYAGLCVTKEFNFSLMIFVWFISIFLCLFFFAIGHIIGLLTAINENLTLKK